MRKLSHHALSATTKGHVHYEFLSLGHLGTFKTRLDRNLMWPGIKRWAIMPIMDMFLYGLP